MRLRACLGTIALALCACETLPGRVRVEVDDTKIEVETKRPKPSDQQDDEG